MHHEDSIRAGSGLKHLGYRSAPFSHTRRAPPVSVSRAARASKLIGPFLAIRHCMNSFVVSSKPLNRARTKPDFYFPRYLLPYSNVAGEELHLDRDSTATLVRFGSENLRPTKSPRLCQSCKAFDASTTTRFQVYGGTLKPKTKPGWAWKVLPTTPMSKAFAA